MFLLSACSKESGKPLETEQEPTEERIKLSSANIDEYIGTNLSFGEIYVTDLPTEDTERISCVCYIDLFPIGDYAFEAATVTVKLEDLSKHVNKSDYPETKWSVFYGASSTNSTSPSGITVSLDKDGYGSACVYLKRNNHPKEVPEYILLGVPKSLYDLYNIKDPGGIRDIYIRNAEPIDQEKIDAYMAYREDYEHPLQSGEWSVKMSSASGTVVVPK